MAFDVEPLRQELRRQLVSFAREAEDEVHQALTAASPIESGELVGSISTRSSRSDARVTIDAETGDLIQAETTEFGARPHTIRPRARKTQSGRPPALKFTVGGTTVIVRKVDHPGNPARPWFFPTLEKWPQIAERVWRRVSR